MALKDFRVKNGLTVESGDITLTNGNINFSNGYMQTDNIKIDGNTISSTDTDGNINVTPNGTGYVMIDGVRWPNALGSNGKFLQTNGSGHLSWVTVATDLSEDTSPQLGGDLDVNGQKIKSVSNGNVTIEANGSGIVQITDTDNANAAVKFTGGQAMYFDMQTEGGASSPGTSILNYTDSGGSGRAFVSIAQDVVRFENRAANGKLEFYANASTAGTNGTTKVMEIEDTDIKIHKTLTMDGAYILLDDDVGIRFYEDDSNGSHYGAIKFPASIASNFTLTFPGDDGGSGEVLTTDGNGALSWTAKTTNTNTTYSTSVVDSSGIKLRLTAGGSGSGTDDVTFAGSGATSVARTDASTITISSTNTTYSEATSSAEGLMSTAHHDKLDGIEAGATADQSNAEIRAAVEAASDSNVFTDADHTKLNGIATSANNYSISSDLLDEDDFSTNSATKPASQQSIKAYVDAEVSGLVDSAPAALNTLNELAAALGDDASFATTTSTALGNRLRIDVSNQSLTGTQKSNALTNLGFTATLAELNVLDGYTGSVTELNYLDTLHATGVTNTEFDYLDGVTSNIQTQLDSKIGAVRAVTAGGNTLATSETLAFTAGTNVTITESGGAVTINSTASGLASLAADSTPQLGGDLDLVTHDIVTTSNRDINLKPNGTGKVVITNTVDSATAGPILELYRDHDGEAADDVIGEIGFRGPGGATGDDIYASITTKMIDVSNLSGDGELAFSILKNETLTKIFDIRPNLSGADPGFNIYGNTRLALWDDDSSNFVAIESPATVSSNYTLTLPADDGSANQVLKTDGNGALSWVDQSSGAVSAVANGANNRVATFSSADALNGEANLTFDGSTLEIVATGATGGIGVSMQNNEGKFLAYTDGGNFVVKDYQIDTGGSTDGTDLYPFKIMGGSANDSLVVSNGLVTVAGDLKVGGNDIKASDGTTAITLSSDDVTIADNLTVAQGNYLYLADSTLRDDGSNFQITGNSQIQYTTAGQYGAHIFYTQDGAGAATEVFKIGYLGNWELGNTRDRVIEMKDTAHGVAGKALTISAGDTTAGTTDNIAGGHLTLEGGIGKGTGAGGNIYFKVADGGSSGSSLNSLATAMTITDDGHIGLGTTSPAKRLNGKNITIDDGTQSSIELLVSDTSRGEIWATSSEMVIGSYGSGKPLKFRTNNDVRMTVSGNGKRVGIGDEDPQSPLHVEQVSNTTFAATNTLLEHLLHLKCNSVTTNAFAGIAFDVSTETDADSIGASISAVRDTSASSTAANHDANLVFSTNDAGDDGNTERMRITHDGKVGIGNNNPSHALDVTGEIHATNTVYGSAVLVNDNSSVYTSAGKLYLGNNDGGSWWIEGDGGSSIINANANHGYIQTSRDEDDLIFRTGASTTTRMTIYGDASPAAVVVSGDFHATTKSFDIEHPTKEGMRLHHGSLEGPEHGVYVRGTLEHDNKVIELPDYWEGLVDSDTITVQLTANKTFQQLYVERIEDNKVYVKETSNNPIDCFYFIQAERKDVDKVKVEY